MRKKIWVGVNTGQLQVFREVQTPTERTHGGKFLCVIGPFRTTIGAKAMVHFGHANPHIQTVTDAERIGKKYADELAKKGEVCYLH